MQFNLLDRILQIEPGVSITAERTLTGQEDYLRDHFPLFPVMPGVLMLEIMSQAASWLLRATDDFHYSVTTLREARNVKYSDFITPGKTLVVTAELIKREGGLATLKTQGTVNQTVAVSGRLILENYQLSDKYPSRLPSEIRVRGKLREIYAKLTANTSPSCASTA